MLPARPQVATRLFTLPAFQPHRDALMASLLDMLRSRMYRAASADCIDILYAMAACNWSHFLLSFLPAYVDAALPALGGGERQRLVALLGGEDLDAPTFERRVLALLNDAARYERCAGAGAS
jgi:hypothetical protein